MGGTDVTRKYARVSSVVLLACGVRFFGLETLKSEELELRGCECVWGEGGVAGGGVVTETRFRL